jgi:hypothetical protein
LVRALLPRTGETSASSLTATDSASSSAAMPLPGFRGGGGILCARGCMPREGGGRGGGKYKNKQQNKTKKKQVNTHESSQTRQTTKQ